MSRPRIFVSSTYYDLKYVRERIENFINAYCFEPILFESDSVYFHPNKPLDISCYNEVSNCHMMILIIGGRYGSLTSDGNRESKKDDYEKQYVSITRKEYETAISKGIPVMIFVEQNVYTEYKTYQANTKKLPEDFKFAYVDDAKIFEFISNLDKNAIKQFNKVDDIEHYFANQISGMLLSYLTDLQREKESKEIRNAVEQINVISQSMQTMLNSIGEKVLGTKQPDKYKELLEQQNRALIDFFIELFNQNSTWKGHLENQSEKVGIVCNILMDNMFDKEEIESIQSHPDFSVRWNKLKELTERCIDEMNLRVKDLKVTIHVLRLSNQLFKIVELISQDDQLKHYFIQKLKTMIEVELSFPF